MVRHTQYEHSYLSHTLFITHAPLPTHITQTPPTRSAHAHTGSTTETLQLITLIELSIKFIVVTFFLHYFFMGLIYLYYHHYVYESMMMTEIRVEVRRSDFMYST